MERGNPTTAPRTNGGDRPIGDTDWNRQGDVTELRLQRVESGQNEANATLAAQTVQLDFLQTGIKELDTKFDDGIDKLATKIDRFVDAFGSKLEAAGKAIEHHGSDLFHIKERETQRVTAHEKKYETYKKWLVGVGIAVSSPILFKLGSALVTVLSK